MSRNRQREAVVEDAPPGEEFVEEKSGVSECEGEEEKGGDHDEEQLPKDGENVVSEDGGMSERGDVSSSNEDAMQEDKVEVDADE